MNRSRRRAGVILLTASALLVPSQTALAQTQASEKGAASTRGEPAAQAASAIGRWVEQYIHDAKVPGVAMAIVDHGRVVEAKGYGLASVELREVGRCGVRDEDPHRGEQAAHVGTDATMRPTGHDVFYQEGQPVNVRFSRDPKTHQVLWITPGHPGPPLRGRKLEENDQ